MKWRYYISLSIPTECPIYRIRTKGRAIEFMYGPDDEDGFTPTVTLDYGFALRRIKCKAWYPIAESTAKFFLANGWRPFSQWSVPDEN